MSGTDKIKKAPFLVGIGASAGGLRAIQELIKALPEKTGAAYVIVQHLSPDFKSLMKEILARFTDIPIHQVENEMRVEPDNIYLIPPKKNMIVSQGKLLLSEQTDIHGLKLPIDIFFRSLAVDYGKNAVAIILSGTGSDGSRGIRHVHDSDGLVIVQDRDTAQFDGMPLAGLNTGIADKITSPEKMAEIFIKHFEKQTGIPITQTTGNQNPDSGVPQDDIEAIALNKLFTLLKNQYHINFKHYKPSTIDRRVLRRVSMNSHTDLRSYVKRLENSPEELDVLYHDLLIGVTRFNRDSKCFDYLRDHQIETILRNAVIDKREVRIWSPGCATGEEPYTLAILFDTVAKKFNLKPKIKIFATDVHKGSLAIASSGVYASEALKELPDSYVHNNFIAKGKNHQISSHIRKMVVFAKHNLISDPPFTNMDMISCRNLLIYLDLPTQKKVFSLFHFAMRPHGILFLGPSENPVGIESDLKKLSSEFKIFEKMATGSPSSVIKALPKSIKTYQPTPILPRTSRPVGYSSAGSLEWAYDALLREYVISGFLVDENKELLHVFGDSKHFIRYPDGKPTTNILNLLPHELSMGCGSAIHRAIREQKTISCRGIRMKEPPFEDKTFVVRAKPLLKRNIDKLFLFVTIENQKETSVQEPDDGIVVDIPVDIHPELADLEAELKYTKENLQASNEDLETSNQELQAANEELVAANEELQSTNEELQSTNEELQSTNEELQSVNEELHTVNIELQENVKELTILNNDIENLLSCTEIGTLILDNSLNIRKFTPHVGKIFNLKKRDIGRPVEDISSELNITKYEFLDLLSLALTTGQKSERRVDYKKEDCILIRVFPYKSENQITDGVIVTFIDISTLKNAEDKIQEYAKRLDAGAQDIQDFAHGVFHDFEAPLSLMLTAATNLQNSIGETISQLDSKALTEIVDAASELKNMVSSLLEFSRIYTKSKSLRIFNLADAISDAQDDLEDEIRKTKAIIKVHDMPDLEMDRAQISKVFYLLIRNLLKTSSEIAPRIEISCQQRSEDWLFGVINHSDGFDPPGSEPNLGSLKKWDSLIKLKYRGIGMALCKKIIEKHHGQIWMDSEEKSAKRIFFTLPK